METNKLGEVFDDSASPDNLLGPTRQREGLGLLTAKALCEKLKGVISVENYPGKGTAFIVIFPKSRE